MGTRLNTDGAKIRALRIQRGWTQEQLAEIAGVSSRTIQRAETADCAAFETVRALAGAFEADFDCLLKTGNREVSDPKPQSVPLPAPGQRRDESVLAAPKGLPPRRIWTTLPIAAAALAAGLLAGAMLFDRPDTPAEARLPAPRQSPPAPAPAEARPEVRPPAASPKQTPLTVSAASKAVTEAPVLNIKPEPTAEKSARHHAPVRAVEFFPPADLGMQTSILSTRQQPLDLPDQSRDLRTSLALLEAPIGPSASILPGDLTQKDQGVGAVRQAMGQAGKKTGEFIGKVGASMRRAF